MFASGPIHEQRHARAISKGTSIRRKIIFACVNDLRKKLAIRNKIEPLGFHRVGFENKQLGVTWFRHLVMLFGTRKCWSQHVLLHLEEQGDHPIGNE
jgi:hypothetical protein